MDWNRSAQRCFALVLCLLVGGVKGVLAHGDYHDVVALLRVQLEEAPQDPDIHYRLAVAHAGHGEWRLCLEAVDRVEEFAAAPYPLAYLRGKAWNAAGDYGRAIEVLDDFIPTHPHHAGAHRERGHARLQRGDIDGAIDDLGKAIALSPSPGPEQFVDLANALHAAGESESASEVLDEGIQALGMNPSILHAAIRIEVQGGLWDQALRRVDAMQSIAPAPETWMLRRAEILERAERPEESRRAWQDLFDHLESLPSLERGTPLNRGILQSARAALGMANPRPVVAPPAGG